MSLIEFLLVSLFEYFSIFALTFQMFSFQLRAYLFELVIISIILGFVTYSLRIYYNLDLISPLVQIILYTFFLWLLLQIHIYNAIIMASVNVFFGVLQIIIAMTLLRFGFIETPINFSDAKMIIYVAGTLMFLISIVLRRFDLRYTFISNDSKFRFKHRKMNIYIVLFLIFLQLAVTWFSYYFFLSGLKSQYMFLAVLATCLILSNFYFLNQEENAGR